MQYSVIRRSLLVSMAFVIGHLFHYALMFFADRILDPGGFGRFYTAISLLNIVALPATVLSFMLVRHFTAVRSAAGTGALAVELNTLMRRHGAIGAILVLVCALALVVIGSLLGADAFLLLMLVPSTAFAFYLFEMGRAALQSMLDFFAYSAAWILWRCGQCVLALVALLLAGAPWAGMAGIFLATVVATLLLLQVVTRRAKAGPAQIGAATWPPFDVAASMPFMFQYGLFTLVCNVDVLLAYLVLTNDQLGSYAASSLLPKAIVTATLPVAQVMLPVVSTWGEERAQVRTALLKALGVALFLSIAGAAVLILGRDLACNDQFGIRFCATPLVTMLAVAAIPVSLSRVLVVASLALERQIRIVAPSLVLLVFAALVLLRTPSPPMLAGLYMTICWIFVLTYALIVLSGGKALRGSFACTPANTNTTRPS
jgi:O-antigen/teichoic acid export membrane protein